MHIKIKHLGVILPKHGTFDPYVPACATPGLWHWSALLKAVKIVILKRFHFKSMDFFFASRWGGGGGIQDLQLTCVVFFNWINLTQVSCILAPIKVHYKICPIDVLDNYAFHLDKLQFLLWIYPVGSHTITHLLKSGKNISFPSSYFPKFADSSSCENKEQHY